MILRFSERSAREIKMPKTNVRNIKGKKHSTTSLPAAHHEICQLTTSTLAQQQHHMQIRFHSRRAKFQRQISSQRDWWNRGNSPAINRPPIHRTPRIYPHFIQAQPRAALISSAAHQQRQPGKILQPPLPSTIWAINVGNPVGSHGSCRAAQWLRAQAAKGTFRCQSAYVRRTRKDRARGESSELWKAYTIYSNHSFRLHLPPRSIDLYCVRLDSNFVSQKLPRRHVSFKAHYSVNKVINSLRLRFRRLDKVGGSSQLTVAEMRPSIRLWNVVESVTLVTLLMCQSTYDCFLQVTEWTMATYRSCGSCGIFLFVKLSLVMLVLRPNSSFTFISPSYRATMLDLYQSVAYKT